MEKEICICAAIKYKDKIWRGQRHNNCIDVARDQLSYNMSRKQMNEESSLFENQGFITSKNRYVDREEGLILQKKAGIKSIAKDGYGKKLLFSEDLY